MAGQTGTRAPGVAGWFRHPRHYQEPCLHASPTALTGDHKPPGTPSPGSETATKSTKPHRIAENINVFDFELSADEITAIDGLDTGRRGGPEPDAITLETFGREIPEA